VENFKDHLFNYIEEQGLSSTEKETFNLISMASFFVYNKSYFNDKFKHYRLERNEIGEIRFVSPTMNKVDGAKNYIVNSFISNPHNESVFEDQFFFSNDNPDSPFINIFLKKEVINNLVEIFNVVKNSKNIKDLNKSFQSLADNNMTALFDLKVNFPEIFSADRQPLIEHLEQIIKVNSNYSKEYLTELSFCVDGEINSFSGKKLKEDNFAESRKLFLQSYVKEMKKVKNVNALLQQNKEKITPLMNVIENKYDFFNNTITRDNLNDIDFYFVKTDTFPSFNSFEDKKHFDPTECKNDYNTNGFLNIKENDFKEFVLNSPAELSWLNRDLSNSIEGLIYIKENELKASSDYDQCFIVAKNQQKETVGLLKINKLKSQKKCYNISEISIKHNYRNIGLAKMFYEKLAELSINNDLIIFNRRYSKEGKKYLPKMKQNICDKHSDFMLVNTDFGEVYENEKLNEDIKMFNVFIEQDIKNLDQKKTIPLKKIKLIYDESIKRIKKHHNQAISFNKDISQEERDLFNSKLKLLHAAKKNKPI
jgi:hypothetical protein